MTAEEVLLKYLKDEAIRCEKSLILPRGIKGFVLKHGQFFKPGKLPKPFRYGPIGYCYCNSHNFLMNHGKRMGLTYVEGYAFSDIAGGSVTIHAWCSDLSGNVLDRTWREPALAYFGIPFQRNYLIEAMRLRSERLGEKAFGILDDWQGDYPLIKQHGDQPVLWKAQIPGCKL